MPARVLEVSVHGDSASQPSPLVLQLATADAPTSVAITFDALRDAALQLVADGAAAAASCSLKYLDSDGDLVTLAGDRDLLALLQYMTDEHLERVTVVVKENRGVVQRQLRGIVAAVTKFAQQLELKDEKPTVADALKWLEKSVAKWEVAAAQAPELAAIRDEVLQVLADADFRRAVEETSEASEFKELVDAVLDAIFKKDETVTEDLLATRFDEIFSFAQRILAGCPALKQVLIRLAKRCAACLVRYNGELLALASADESQSGETVSVNDEASVSSETAGPVVAMCYACRVSPIVGTFYRSESNAHMELCESCFSTGEYHDDSDDFVAVTDEQLVRHPGVMCDGCEMFPIAGVRYKALNDKDFDLCAACEAGGKWASHEPFVKITDPSRAPKKPRDDDTLVHPFVTCDGCGMNPIVGKRFKSTVVFNFDLCESCEASGTWNATHAPFAAIEAGDFRGKKAWFKFSEGKFKKHCGPHGHRGHGHHGHGRHGHRGHHGRHGRHGRHGHHGEGHDHHHDGGDDRPHPHPHPHHHHHHRGHHGRGGRGPAAVFFPGWRENMQLQARFVVDVTIPDGCVVSPSSNLRKSWKLENSGETAWPHGCHLVIQAGNPTFGIQAENNEISLPALQPGEQVVAEVDVRAPSVPGRYTTYWRVCDPSGTQFGHRFWIDIVVADSDDEIISASGIGAASSGAASDDVVVCNSVDLTTVDDDDDSDDSSESSDSDSDSNSNDSDSDSDSDSDDSSSEDSDDNHERCAPDDAGAVDAASTEDDSEVEIVGVRAAEQAAQEDQYRDALAMLASMGFTDAAKNRRHLESTDGNVTDAVVMLLAE